MPRKTKQAFDSVAQSAKDLAAYLRVRSEATTLEAAEAFLRASLGRDGTESWPADAFGRERVREVACLADWVKARGLWIPPKLFRGRRTGGQEHDLIDLGTPVERIVKNTRGGFFGVYPLLDSQLAIGNPSDCLSFRPATPHQYLCRLLAQNALVPSLNRLEGCTEIGGHTSIVISQPYLVGEPAEEREIAEFFCAADFRAVCIGAWYLSKTNLAVFDATSNNVLRIEQRLIPFDVVALHPGAEMRATIESIRKTRRGKR